MPITAMRRQGSWPVSGSVGIACGLSQVARRVPSGVMRRWLFPPLALQIQPAAFQQPLRGGGQRRHPAGANQRIRMLRRLLRQLRQRRQWHLDRRAVRQSRQQIERAGGEVERALAGTDHRTAFALFGHGNGAAQARQAAANHHYVKSHHPPPALCLPGPQARIIPGKPSW